MNLKVRLRFEVEVYFPNFESARVGECTSRQWSLVRVSVCEETGDLEERSVSSEDELIWRYNGG